MIIIMIIMMVASWAQIEWAFAFFRVAAAMASDQKTITGYNPRMLMGLNLEILDREQLLLLQLELLREEIDDGPHHGEEAEGRQREGPEKKDLPGGQGEGGEATGGAVAASGAEEAGVAVAAGGGDAAAGAVVEGAAGGVAEVVPGAVVASGVEAAVGAVAAQLA